MNKEETIGALRRELATAKRRVEFLTKSLNKVEESGPVVLQVGEVLAELVAVILQHRETYRANANESNKVLWGVADEFLKAGWNAGTNGTDKTVDS